MEQESTYVGIDVAKAQVDVAVRPTGEVGCLLRRVRGWGTGRPTGGPGSCLVLLEAWAAWNCHWWQLWQLRRCP